MKKLKQKISERGSILAYSLIIMSVMLMIAVGISSVSIIGKKSASTSGSSTQTLQTADSGIKLAIKKLDGAAGADTLATIFGASCQDVAGVANVDLTTAGLPGSITVTFTMTDGTTSLRCDDAIDLIANIRSAATFENTTRAVQVALAAGGQSVTGSFSIYTDASDILCNRAWGDGVCTGVVGSCSNGAVKHSGFLAEDLAGSGEAPLVAGQTYSVQLYFCVR